MTSSRKACIALAIALMACSGCTEICQRVEAHRETKLGASQLPADVVTAIKETASLGDVYSVAPFSAFNGQVLKANVISFQSGASIDFKDLNVPWVAIVARTFKYDAPNQRTTLRLLQGHQTASGISVPRSAKPAKKPKADIGSDGERGVDGQAGQNGQRGGDGTVLPKLYIIAGNIAAQSGGPPSYLDLTIESFGADGGSGGPGQDGQAGGDGGDGGDGEMGPFGCRHSASNGGPGGNAGGGGKGGDGGNGASGANITYAGSQATLDLLEFAKANNYEGRAGVGGTHGGPGQWGFGGARGSHPGVCTGGDSGAHGNPAPPSQPDGETGHDGTRGVISESVVDVSVLFSQ